MAMLPPYNEHVLLDYGGLNLGFGLMFAVVAVTLDRLLIRTVSAGYLAFAVPHVCRQSTGCVLAGCYRSSLPALSRRERCSGRLVVRRAASR
ncbi:hypothetical protein [Streptosporangium canum]|uniref:hypothetical protein n=1 Tax=Streptosporangium canum TaxID=324952 RepID=UPI00378E7493